MTVTQPQHVERNRQIAAKSKIKKMSGSQSIWSFSNLDTLRVISERWVNSLTSSGTIAFYAGGMALLVIAAGYLSWVLDIRPSLLFGQHIADTMVTEWFNPNMITTMVVIISITPNLLEFFAVGLAANGNVIVDIAIKAAIIFDAATDAPMAFAISKAVVSFFIKEASLGSDLLAVIVSVPVLLLSTIVIEIMLLSFVVAFGLLIRRSFEMRHPYPFTERSHGKRARHQSVRKR